MKRRRLKFSDYYNNIIMTELADIYEVDKERMFLGSRKKNIIFAKRMYIYILREMFGLTLMEIASVTNLHHSSIIHHTRKFKFFYNNYTEESKLFKRVECKIIEVELDEEILEKGATHYAYVNDFEPKEKANTAPKQESSSDDSSDLPF